MARRLTDIKVVVCDIRLGEDNGFDVIDALQEQGMTVPVLYITGYASSLDQQLEQMKIYWSVYFKVNNWAQHWMPYWSLRASKEAHVDRCELLKR